MNSSEQVRMRRAALQYSISQAPIFGGLPEEDLRRLAEYCRLIGVPKGEYLFREGDSVQGFFVVRTGLINVHRTDLEGREQMIHLLRPGHSFAERAIISESGYPANARAMEDSEVILVPQEEFVRHQRDRSDLAWRMLVSMSHHLRALVSTLEGMRFSDLETRVMHWLLQRCPNEGGSEPVEISLGASQSALAVELGTRRETLSRMFRKLVNEKTIQKRPRSIVVLNPARLLEHFSRKAAKAG